MNHSAKAHTDAQLQTSGALTTSRIQSLGDNIFGFAMTLLVLNFLVPQLTAEGSLEAVLVRLVPSFLTYFISFIVLGVMWVSQQNQYHFIERSDRFFLWVNIFFLMFVVCVPFSTHMLALYHGSKLAILLYASNLLVCGFLLYVHWVYATAGHRLVHESLDDRTILVVKFRFIFIIALVAFAAFLSLISIFLTLLLFVPAMILGMSPAFMDKITHEWLGQ